MDGGRGTREGEVMGGFKQSLGSHLSGRLGPCMKEEDLGSDGWF